MPLYEYRCGNCGKVQTGYAKVVQCNDPGPACCGEQTKRIMSIPRLKLFTPYVSPVTERMITSKAEQERDLRQSGCRLWTSLDEERAMAASVKAADEAREEKELTAAVESAFRDLPDDYKRALETYVPGPAAGIPFGEVDTTNMRVYE